MLSHKRSPHGDARPAGRTSTACRWCGGPAYYAFSSRDRFRRLTHEAFRYARCARCHTLSLLDVPDDLGRYYPPSYYGVPRSADEALERDPNAAHRIKLVRSHKADGRLIEVGPSIGAFVELARREGYDVSAIEQDPDCSRFIRAGLGVPVTVTDDPASALDGPYDAIVMWHVIEHLARPRDFVAAAAKALAPGGLLVMAAPNPRSLQARLLGGRWVHIDPPRHLALVPPEAVTHDSSSLGLDVVVMTAADEDAARSNSFGWCETFAGITEDARAQRVLRAGGELLARALAPIERSGMHGASYTAVLRRAQ